MVSYYPAGSVDYDCSYPHRNMKIISDILKGADSIDSTIDEWIISENKLIMYLGSKTRVVVPEGITAIGRYAFAQNGEIISIILPDGVTDIKDMAFGYCSSLTSLTLTADIEKISDFAFDFQNDLDFNNDLTIYAPIGSYAEQYAKEHNIKFEGI